MAHRERTGARVVARPAAASAGERELKIDRSLIANLVKFKQDQIIVRSVIGMARELGLSAVAEGIEDQETMSLLVDMECAYGQGFYLARPLAPEDANRMIEQSAPRFAMLIRPRRYRQLGGCELR